MSVKRGLALLLLLPLLFVLNSCKTFTWNQKLTVTVEAPSGEVSGSSVTRMKVISKPKTLPDAGTVEAKLTGEAVVVEVLPGRYLFALLDLGWAEAAYADARTGIGKEGFEDFMRHIVAQKGKPAVPLPPDALPRLVTFGDISDPTSVALVDPDNLAASFGPGVRLKSVTLEITDEPVTARLVEKVLPWL
ncbi:MAG: hypothetical protein WBB85_05545, partial [Albidovulum sp.]|uniref:hypothetical protein n=1 Tax=Albidovulum sp. TaxID=1872424 RepID=UPI003CC1FA5A